MKPNSITFIAAQRGQLLVDPRTRPRAPSNAATVASQTPAERAGEVPEPGLLHLQEGEPVADRGPR